MPFNIVRQDITKMKVDAIVNAANSGLVMGGGVCGMIFQEAGITDLKAACAKLSPIPTGTAVITPGFNLLSKYIIHAVGPIYSSIDPKQSEEVLYSAYYNSLKIARENDCKSIAFPLISSGIYGYPKKDALIVATKAIRDFLLNEEMKVYLVIFDKESFEISEELVGNVKSYINENYVIEKQKATYSIRNTVSRKKAQVPRDIMVFQKQILPQENAIEGMVEKLDEPFNIILFRLIDAKGKSDVEIYKKANIDRKLFSKIRTGKGYNPSKRTALALAIALELNLDETEDLLKRAGYSLSHSQKFDVIIEYFIINKKYDIFEINDVLFQFDLPLLGI